MDGPDCPQNGMEPHNSDIVFKLATQFYGNYETIERSEDSFQPYGELMLQS